jgi:hypothetical protein
MLWKTGDAMEAAQGEIAGGEVRKYLKCFGYVAASLCVSSVCVQSSVCGDSMEAAQGEIAG